MFRGVGTALVTPFTESGSLDESALARFVDWQITEGINFLVPCGTTGENPALTAAEHQRVVEISACGCLEHSGMRPGTAEVLVWNVGQANPVGSAVSQWIGSPTHNGILSDRQLGRIGCAERTVAGVHWFACVLAAGPLPAPPPAAPVVVLPDTAMP